jgi:hypothetical protein
MRLLAFVLGLMVFAPAVGSTDAIGLAMFTVTENGTQRVVMNQPGTRVYCSRHGQCNGDGCTPVPVTSVSYFVMSSTDPFLVRLTFADRVAPGTTLPVRGDGMTPTTTLANVAVQTMPGVYWQVQTAGTVRVDENQYDASPFRGVFTLTGVTDGTRTLEGTIECPDVYEPPPGGADSGGGGGGCGGGGGGGGGIDD